MSIQILDCTIRDGGYLLNKDSDSDFVNGVIKGLVDSGIDLIEYCFLESNGNEKNIVFSNSNDSRIYIPADKGKTEFVGFCDNSSFSADKLDDFDGKSFTSFRIAFSRYEINEAINFGKIAKQKGYNVFIQPKDTPCYTYDEISKLVDLTNEIKPTALSIVDTYGTMYLEEFEKMFKHIDSKLDKEIKIGLHSHNNLQMSCALAERMVCLSEESERSVSIDGSLFGMGKGAGNANTEIIADYINKHCGQRYNIGALLETIEKYIIPMKNRVHWGYDIPMFICGTDAADVDNIGYLAKNTQCTYGDMYKAISALDSDARKHYGSNGIKVDFSNLENEIKKLK